MITTAVAEASSGQAKGERDVSGNATGMSDHSQVVSFRLANEEYGLDIMSVQEIIRMDEVTAIPEAPAYVRGLINLRGKVIPIVDLRKRFGLEVGEATEHTRIIVVIAANSTFGIVVDAVNEVLRMETDQIEPPPTGLLGGEQAYIKGLVKMEEKIMILLNLERILSNEDRETIAGSMEAAA